MTVYCVDIGSEKNNNFAWAKSRTENGTKLTELKESIENDILNNNSIYIGFECPLFFEMNTEPSRATKARKFDGNRAWSASAGAQSAITGLAQITWLFSELKETINSNNILVDLLNNLHQHNNVKGKVLIWEAFVSGRGKKSTSSHEKNGHIRDCLVAIETFKKGEFLNPILDADYFSIIGSILLRTKCVTELEILEKPCIIVKP